LVDQKTKHPVIFSLSTWNDLKNDREATKS
jgi:hypothetical protein